MTAPTSSHYIFLYNSDGAHPVCVEETTKKLKANCSKYSVIAVDSSYILRESAPSLYVLPGGSAMQMGIALKSATKKIQSCVQKKGSGMLGICAGAMVACSKWEYLVPTRQTPYEAGIVSSSEYLCNFGPHPEVAEWSQNHGYPLSDKDVRHNNHLFKESCLLAGIEVDPPSSTRL
jgi:Biotin-protein ligase, N terminal